jgi:hypothetical protein
MNNYNNKYYFIPPEGVVHVKEYHPQTSSSIGLLELDDWAGPGVYKLCHYFLNNGNMMVEVNDIYLKSLTQGNSYSFKNELVKEMNNAIDEVKKLNFYKRNFKDTPLRWSMIRKYYGKP